VGPSAPFFGEIAWLADQGLSEGYPDGTFRALEPITRQAMAAFLHRLAGQPAAPDGAPSFGDVGADHPFHAAISGLADTGAATGYADGTFRPSAPVSRQATAAFLHRLAGEPIPPGGAPSFSDVRPGHPFRTQITWLAATGITTGYPDGTFRGSAAVSRQAMAAFLYRRTLLGA
jgi:hypothetical protein